MADPKIDVATGREAVPSDWAKAWKEMNPTASVQDMNQDYFMAKAGKVKPTEPDKVSDKGLSGQITGKTRADEAMDTLIPSPGKVFRAARDVLNPVVAAMGQHGPSGLVQKGLSAITGGAVPQPESETRPDAAEMANTVAHALVPQTPAAGAALLAGGPAAKGLVNTVKALPGMIGRGAVVGAGANAAGGENPVQGAETGAITGGLPPIVGGMVKGAGWVKDAFMKLAGKEKIRDTVTLPAATRFMEGLKEDVPALWAKIRNEPGSIPAKLAQIHDTDTFASALKKPMDVAEHAIATATPQIVNPFPPPPTVQAGGWAAGASPAQIAKLQALGVKLPGSQSPAGPPMMDTVTAFEQWHKAVSAARAMERTENPGLAHPLWETAKQWEDAIAKSVPSHLMDLWQAGRAEFGRGLAYQDLHRAAVANAGPEAAGTSFDPAGVMAKFWQNPSRYSRSYIPGFHANYWGANELGTQAEVADPGIYARAFLPAGAKFNIPVPKAVTQPGAIPMGRGAGTQNAANTMQDLTRVGVMNLGHSILPGAQE